MNITLISAIKDDPLFNSLELEGNLRGATNFIEIDEVNALLTISPTEEDQVAEYLIDAVLTNGNQEFIRQMILNVISGIEGNGEVDNQNNQQNQGGNSSQHEGGHFIVQ